LNDVHLPTGYVTFEDVIRFCVVDLEVAPLAQNWHRVLRESHRRFMKEFAPVGQV
jgi:hypothetical protein